MAVIMKTNTNINMPIIRTIRTQRLDGILKFIVTSKDYKIRPENYEEFNRTDCYSGLIYEN
jgi:hypothetical protein